MLSLSVVSLNVVPICLGLACVAVVSVSFWPSGRSVSQAGYAPGHGAKRSKKIRNGGGGGVAPFHPMPSRISNLADASPAWLKGNGNDCYAG